MDFRPYTFPSSLAALMTSSRVYYYYRVLQASPPPRHLIAGVYRVLHPSSLSEVYLRMLPYAICPQGRIAVASHTRLDVCDTILGGSSLIASLVRVA